ncbi:MAG: GTP 3',8-cyclase MoaA [Actinobacteria bacterium]|nr:GTP 3',8-cyclase MoaA [Actinomycetota bacterium]
MRRPPGRPPYTVVAMQGLPVTTDARGRVLRDLRLSVTDRCNFRCTYCMPRDVFGPGFAFLPREELLSFEELVRITRVAARLGTRKVRLTGGEPLLRRDLPDLVAGLVAVDGVEDVALTTNGALLRRHAARLREAGLHRVTVSLDSLDDATFRRMSDVDLPVTTVLDGIAAAVEVGFAVKVNVVVKRGVNDDGILDLADWGRRRGHTVRFIEFMDVGATNGWRMADVVPAEEILATVGARWELSPVPPAVRGEVASRYRYVDGGGEVGLIASVTRPFCGACSRARVSAIGELFTCLFAVRGHDLRAVLRSGGSDADLEAAMAGVWHVRDDRYSEERTAGTGAPVGDARVEMSYIGG